MSLFFELGNSRLKAASLSKDHYEFLGAVDKSEIDEQTFIQSFGLTGEEPESIYLCSVAGSVANAQLIEQLTQAFKCYPTLITTQPKCCGITCGYPEFEKLGVDRWMSILGASAGSSKPVLIVSAGTALTVDVVIDKQHLGGFIVPGLTLMRRSLSSNTALLKDVTVPDSKNEIGLLATDTDNAILGGTLYMAASYINSLIKDLENETGRRFDCIGTGGDFHQLQPLMDKTFSFVEDLAILGMIKVIESC